MNLVTFMQSKGSTRLSKNKVEIAKWLGRGPRLRNNKSEKATGVARGLRHHPPFGNFVDY